MPGGRFDEPQNIRGGSPFAIWVADPVDGKAIEIWTSPGADGGYAQRVGEALSWLNDETLVFQSEHEDWLRPYAINAGGKIRALIDRPCEIGDSIVA
jgi:hypothetical protein